MKQYIRDFENFVLRMTPTDLALYTAAKCDSWQTYPKSIFDEIIDNTVFLPTHESLVQEVCPDSQDSRDAPIMLAVESNNVCDQSQCNRSIGTAGVFSNDEFLQQLEAHLEN